MALTWRTIGNGGAASAGSLLSMGQQQVTQGLGVLNDLLKQNQLNEQRNALAVRDNNTQSYLDQVAAAGGAEALANPEIRAQLEQTRAGFGAAIDRGATRGAIDDRLSGLQKQAVQTGAYEDQQAERNQRATVDQLYTLAANGDQAGVNKILDEQQLFNEGKLRAELTGTFDKAQDRIYRQNAEGRAERSEGRAIESHGLSMENMRVNMANSVLDRQMRIEDRNERKEDRQYIKDAATLDGAVKQAQALEEAGRAKNIFANPSKNPIEDANKVLADLPKGEFDAWLSTNKGDREKMTKSVVDLLRDGITLDGENVPVPPQLLTTFLNNTKGKMYLFNSPAKDLRKDLETFAQDNAGIGMAAKEGKQIREATTRLVNALQRKKTELGGSKNLDTSDIVKQLSMLAAGIQAPEGEAGQFLLPGPEEDEKFK